MHAHQGRKPTGLQNIRIPAWLGYMMKMMTMPCYLTQIILKKVSLSNVVMGMTKERVSYILQESVDKL